MAVLLRDDFNGTSLDTSKWGTQLGFSGGNVTVHDGLCELDGGSLNPTILYSLTTFPRTTLFASCAIPIVTGSSSYFGFLETDYTHRVAYSGAYPGAILMSNEVYGHSTPANGNISLSAHMDDTVTVFGLSMNDGPTGATNIQMWQLISDVWIPVGGHTTSLTPTYDYSLFAMTTGGNAIGVDWIQLEDKLPTATPSALYYEPTIHGSLTGTSQTNFATPRTR